MLKQKRALAIHDISCVGRCSLTVALPVLSAAGVNTAVLPTAVLSTHTGEFTGYTHRDLTDEILPIARHWQSLGLSFHAVYSGYLANAAQAGMVADVCEMFKADDTIVLTDPVMGDNGRLYAAMDAGMIGGMARLCSCADVAVPNLTEAAFMLGRPYADDGYDRTYIEKILNELLEIGAQTAVLTGVSFDAGTIGAAGINRGGDPFYYFCDRAAGMFHGTGDIFASVLLATLMNGKNLQAAIKKAVDFTRRCISHTEELGWEKRYGVCFEKALPYLFEL